MNYQELGHDTYDQYLDSDEWKKIKTYFYALSETYQCRLCHLRNGLVLHKRTYHFLRFDQFRKLPEKYVHKILVYLCSDCNHQVHFYPDESKVPLDSLFLMDREEEVYNSWKYIVLRFIRDCSSLFKSAGYRTRKWKRNTSNLKYVR